jgi:hypothetical protein
MKATELRLGNIVACIEEPGKPDVVILLEPGVVQLMNRSEEDDENNVIGVPLTSDLLSSYGIGEETHVSGKALRILQGADSDHFLLRVGENMHPVRFVHELQNLVLALCGEDLIKHPYIHFVGESV